MMFSFFGAQNHAEDDVTPQGGAIELTRKVEFTQWTVASPVALASDGPDTRTGVVTGRLQNGTMETEAFVLNGINEVLLTKVWERLLKVVLNTTDIRNVSVKQGSGGLVRMLIDSGVKENRMTFIDSFSTSLAQVKRYEKIFLRTNQDVNNVNLTLTADPDARIQVGVALTVNDTELLINRLTAPVGITFVDDNVPIAIPNLLAGEVVGVWIMQQLLRNDPDHRSNYALSVAGVL